jgi:hypothetical protein
VVSAKWKHGFSKIKSVQTIKAGYWKASYMLKESSFFDGTREVPFFISPTLQYELNHDIKKEEYRKKMARKYGRERKFWMEGVA